MFPSKELLASPSSMRLKHSPHKEKNNQEVEYKISSSESAAMDSRADIDFNRAILSSGEAMETSHTRVYRIRYVVEAAISHQPLRPLDLILIKISREAISHSRKLSRKGSKSFLTFVHFVRASVVSSEIKTFQCVAAALSQTEHSLCVAHCQPKTEKEVKPPSCHYCMLNFDLLP